MRSLKIIIFRDTDKPYTMILSPKILIGTSFSIIALFSLLTFSVMSNVMFVTNANSSGPQQNGVQGIFADNKNNDENMDRVEEKDPEQPLAEDNLPAEENDNPELPPADENTTGEQPAAKDASNPVEENVSRDTVEDKPAIEEPAVQDGNDAEVSPLKLDNGEMEVALLSNPAVTGNSIRVKAQVRKTTNRGVATRGRFVAALLDNFGNLGGAFPVSVRTEGNEILNPEKGDSFRIKYSRDYDIRFDNINPEDYASIVLMIYDQDSLNLIWRDVLPVSR